MTDEQIVQELKRGLSFVDAPIGEHWVACASTKAVKEAIDLIHRQKAEIERLQSGWISVKDKMPPKHSRVLCYFKYTPELEDVIAENEYHGGGYWLTDGDKVTHWMPLPPPPKGA